MRMHKKENVKRALFSVPLHGELEGFVAQLRKAGWVIIATANVYEFFLKKRIRLVNVADFVGVHSDYGFPPTLHPKMEAALTGAIPERIDLVYDIPYGPEKGNDVGGRTLLALAAKGNRIPVMSPQDMKAVTDALVKKEAPAPELVAYLQAKANFEIAGHYLALARGKERMADFDGALGVRRYFLHNGENPYQVPAALYGGSSGDRLALSQFKQVAGDLPCFTNLADFDSILETLCKLQASLALHGIKKPYIAVAAKHGNPCGAGVSLTHPEEAVTRALWGNARAIWGGELIVNFVLDGKLASLLKESRERKRQHGVAAWMLDVVVAAGMDAPARKILSGNPHRKLFVNPALRSPFLRKEPRLARSVRGGFLSQPPADYLFEAGGARWINEPLKGDALVSLIIAWAVAYTSSLGGNEVALARHSALLSSGGGPSTVDAAHLAVSRAKEQGHHLQGAVFAADAFFPFTDAPKVLVKNGCAAGTVPAGGKREAEVVAYFRKNSTRVAFIPEDYRGFCRH
jgi:AICAR transformylase/IMP cyclohydrolase PurH